MSDQITEKIQFSLRGLSTEQFALIETAFNDKDEIRIQHTIRFARSDERKWIGAFGRLEFIQNDNPFIIIDIGAHFELTVESWELILDTKNLSLMMPQNFAIHLAAIAFSSARGVLHDKLEKTPFNMFFIPLLDLTKIIQGDVEIGFEKIVGHDLGVINE